MQPKIFIDMDGVLADYFTAVFDCFNLKLEDYKAHLPWKYAIHEWVSEMLGQTYTHEEMYPHLYRMNGDFWDTMMPYPWASGLIYCAQNLVGKENVFIVTHPQPDAKCFAGKLYWLQQNVPIVPVSNIIYCTNKQLLARPESILIDDWDDNVTNFRLAGGEALIFPRPWNNSYMLTNGADIWVIERLESICKQIRTKK